MNYLDFLDVDGGWGLTLVVEQVNDLLGDGGYDGGVEQGVQTGQQQSTDDNGDQDFNAGVHIAFGFAVHDGSGDTGANGIELVGNLLEHDVIPHTFLVDWFAD